MNTAPPAPLRGATILELDPTTIDVDLSGRLGFFFEDKARAFGKLLKADGQRDLAKVSRAPAGSERPWRLHVGLHRTMGAFYEGLPIFAVEWTGTKTELLELEASENLHRRVLEPIELAKFIAAFCQTIEERLAREHGDLKQQQRAIKARWAKAKDHKEATETALAEEATHTSDTMSHVYGWADSAVEAFGLDKRTIYRALKIYRQVVAPFPAEMVRALADHPVVGRVQKQLLDIASIESEDQRRQVIEMLIADRELSADDARVRVGLDNVSRAPTPFEKFTSQISNGLSRLSATEQKRALPDVAASLKSAEVKRQLRDLLNEQLGERPGRREMRPALHTVFDLLIKLGDGEPVEDDEIATALDLTQRALGDAPDAAEEPVLTFGRLRQETANG